MKRNIQQGLLLCSLLFPVYHAQSASTAFDFIKAEVSGHEFIRLNDSMVTAIGEQIIIPIEIIDIGRVGNDYPPYWWQFVEKRRKHSQQAFEGVQAKVVACISQYQETPSQNRGQTAGEYLGEIFTVDLTKDLPMTKEIPLVITSSGKYSISIAGNFDGEDPDCFSGAGRANILSVFAFENKVAFALGKNTYSEQQRQYNALKLMAIDNLKVKSASSEEIAKEVTRLQQKHFESRFRSSPSR